MTFQHGYYTGSPYTFGAYVEPSPERLGLLCLLRSHRPPDLSGPFRVLEFGCGQGLHLCLQAANYPQAHFLGVDVSPEHIAHARSLARAAALTNIEFLQADIQELEQDSGPLDQPWDLVVAHGVLGWVSPALGATLLRLAASVLRPGGLLYVSYNAQPGWLGTMPFQHAVRSLQQRNGNAPAALQGAQELFQEMRGAKAALFQAQPGLTTRLDGLGSQDSSYLLHEYNHSQWQPLYCNQVHEPALDLGLQYLGSASLPENFEGLLPASLRQQLQRQQDPILRELVRDLFINQVFRRDVFCKGRDPLWPREAMAALDQIRVLRLIDEPELAEPEAFHFPLSFGGVEGNQGWFRSLLEGMGDQPLSLAELQAHKGGATLPELLQNLALLIGKGALTLVPPERDPAPAHRLNRVILERVAAGAPYRSLACPRSGNQRSVNDIDLLALHALQQGWPEEQLAVALDQALQALERRPLRDGQPLEGGDSLAAMRVVADNFRSRTLPVLRRLGVET